MSEISFCCPKCGHAYRFAAEIGGKRGRCKECHEVFRVPPQSAPAAGPVRPMAATPSPVTPRPARPAEPDKIVFNCPTCGHGYRLAAQLAGKQGRCTVCRGIFMIPLRSQSSPPAAAGRGSEASAWDRASGPAAPGQIPSNTNRDSPPGPGSRAPRSIPAPSPPRSQSKSPVPISPNPGTPPGRGPARDHDRRPDSRRRGGDCHRRPDPGRRG